MLASDEGRALVEEYYHLAPAIVTTVRLCWDEKAVYDKVYRDYLLPCLGLLEAGDEKGCGTSMWRWYATWSGPTCPSEPRSGKSAAFQGTDPVSASAEAGFLCSCGGFQEIFYNFS